jgi:hypothetical protein
LVGIRGSVRPDPVKPPWKFGFRKTVEGSLGPGLAV